MNDGKSAEQQRQTRFAPAVRAGNLFNRIAVDNGLQSAFGLTEASEADAT